MVLLFVHRIKRRKKRKHICHIVEALLRNIVHIACVKRKVASGNPVDQLCVGGRGSKRERVSQPPQTPPTGCVWVCVCLSVY